MKAILSVAACAAIVSLAGCGAKKETRAIETQPMKVIFETDMGNDIDDALAFDMLMKYRAVGKVELLGVSTNKIEDGSVEYIDNLTTYYGCSEIPLGNVSHGVPYLDAVNYAGIVSQMKDEAGKPLFARTHVDDGFVKPSVQLYRELLAAAPDTSVTIVSVGFFTNLAQLLDSEGDDISPLSGKELVAKKVKQLVAMAGEFRCNAEADSLNRMAEFNVVCDRNASAKVFSQWPTPIVASPYEVGEKILFPAKCIEDNLGLKEPNPVVEGYKSYLPMPYDRPTWDLTALLYAVEGADCYFTESAPGRIEVDSRGATHHVASAGGTHRYLLTDSIQDAKIKSRLIEIITAPIDNQK